MALQLEPHGGNCCGMTHLFDINARYDWRTRKRVPLTVDDIRSAVKSAWEEIEQDRASEYDEYNKETGEYETKEVPWKVFGHAVEVVLTDSQMVEYAAMFKEAGFKLCFRWKNDNSGNYCNLLMYSTKKCADKRPYTW